jgi:hypothetical protein
MILLLMMIRGRIGIATAHVTILKGVGGHYLMRPQEVGALLMVCGEGDERGARI